MPNLLDDKNKSSGEKIDPSVYYQSSLKKKRLKWWLPSIILLIIIILIGLGFLTKAVMAVNSTNRQSGEKIGFFEQIKNLISNPEKQLRGEASDRINFLLAGIGGSGHDGAYLADTIIFASFKPSTNEIALISIPRDLYVNIPELGWRKINNAMAFGYYNDYPGKGEALLKKTVEQVIGQPINYYARIDFEGFKKIVDDIGGIDIYVDRSFSDYQYPDYHHGYQTIKFKKGWQHMDGEKTLQYVRSRHGTNGEGSDFARSQRQQKVLFALKDKLISLNTLVNPSKIISALNDLGNHNKTDLQIWEIMKLAKLSKNVTPDKIITAVLETGNNGLLVSSKTLDGAYILKPRTGDYSEIQALAENIFKKSLISKEKARIEIQNSTSTTGLAAETANKLKAMNFNVVAVANSKIPESLKKTTIYDLSGGAKPYTIASLKKTLQATLAPNLPPFMVNQKIDYNTLTNTGANNNISTTAKDIDILIIIGQDLTSDTQLGLANRYL